jgi:hypothetical protein
LFTGGGGVCQLLLTVSPLLLQHPPPHPKRQVTDTHFGRCLNRRTTCATVEAVEGQRTKQNHQTETSFFFGPATVTAAAAALGLSLVTANTLLLKTNDIGPSEVDQT